MKSELPSAAHPVVVFDGYCALCNGVVDALLHHDRTGTLRFTSFQQPATQDLLTRHGLSTAPETVYVLLDTRVLQEADAILYLLPFLGPWWQPLSLLRLLPRQIRDRLYRWVARNRYRWFGKRDTCRLPTPEERDRFV